MNPYPTPTYLAGSAHTHHSLPLSSRQDAELQWEMSRRELRASLAGLPSSSFAHTMLEEDDLFYATFPDARQAAIDLWASENLMQGSYVEALAPQPSHLATLESPTAAMPHTHHALSPVNHPAHDIPHLNHLEARPSSLQLNYTYDAVDPQPNTGPPFVDHRALVDQGRGSRVTPDVYRIGEQSSIPKPSPPPPEIIRIAPHLLVPSQRQGGVQLPPTVPQLELAGHLSSPSFSNTADTPPCSPSSARPAFSSSPVIPSPASSSVVPLQYTGDWEADAIAAQKLLTASQPSHPTHRVVPSMNQQDSPHVPRLSLAHHKHQATRSRSHPYSSSTSRSPSASRTSPSGTRNPVKLPRNKDGKPAMACLFCRGRKIACGPPLPGSNSSTCNQCERRHLKCKYPAVNRRGMRRKKEEGDGVDAKKKDKGGISGEAKKDNGDRVVNSKKHDRDQAVDTNSASKRTPSISSAKVRLVKAEYSESEDVAMSDVDDSSSEWDSDD